MPMLWLFIGREQSSEFDGKKMKNLKISEMLHDAPKEVFIPMYNDRQCLVGERVVRSVDGKSEE